MAMRQPEHYAMLLRVRKRQEDIRAQAFAGAQREVNRARLERQAIEESQRRIMDEATDATRTLSEPDRAHSLLRFERHLAKQAVLKDSEILENARIAEERRAELGVAMLRRRTIERLIERARLARLAMLRTQERRAMDEIASIRAALSRKERPRGEKEE